jgi:hypothetical protein
MPFLEMRLVKLPLVVPGASQKGEVTSDRLGRAPVAVFINVFVGLTAKTAFHIQIIGQPLKSHIAWEPHIGPSTTGTDVKLLFAGTSTT